MAASSPSAVIAHDAEFSSHVPPAVLVFYQSGCSLDEESCRFEQPARSLEQYNLLF
jgi:hypothetical protein